MKQILVITFLILGLSAVNSAAQMGHGMMRGGHMTEQDDHMMDEKGLMDDKKYRQPDDMFTRKQEPADEITLHRLQMMNGMVGMTQDLAIMMRQMSVMMGNITQVESKLSNQDMQRFSAMMKDMAKEMNRISDMMGKGSTTPEEVRAMQDRMIEMQEQMRALNRQE